MQDETFLGSDEWLNRWIIRQKFQQLTILGNIEDVVTFKIMASRNFLRMCEANTF